MDILSHLILQKLFGLQTRIVQSTRIKKCDDMIKMVTEKRKRMKKKKRRRMLRRKRRRVR